MKKIKTLTALILLLTLTLSSCSSLMEELAKDPEDTPTPPVQSGGEVVTPDTGGAALPDPEGFTLFPEGDYLEERFRTSDPLPGFDAVDASFRGTFRKGGTPTACSTDDTLYYLNKSKSRAYFLRYMDKATGISGVLCGKPECTHTGTSCNGYMGGHATGLSLYDGRLWWLDQAELIVYSCALDGSDHREELSIERRMVGYGSELSGLPDIYFHRGAMYWANQQLVVTDGVNHFRSDLFAFPLDGSEPYTVFQAMDAGFPYVYAHGDELVIICDRSERRDEERYYAMDVFTYDLNSRKASVLFSGETDFTTADQKAVLREDGIYQMGEISGVYTADRNWAYVLRFLPWEGGGFIPVEIQGEDAPEICGVHYSCTLTDGAFTVSVRALEGESLLEASFPDTGIEVNGSAILMGWDESCYYFEVNDPVDWNSVIARAAVSADGEKITVFDKTEASGSQEKIPVVKGGR